MDVPGNDIDDVLRWGLTVVILVSLVGILYFALTPQATGDQYTELYALGPDGNASDYPANLSTGDRGELIIGVTNKEKRTTEYTVVMQLENETLETRSFTLSHGETWEEPFTFSPASPGEKRLEVLLFVGDDPDTSEDPYRRLWFPITVSRR